MRMRSFALAALLLALLPDPALAWSAADLQALKGGETRLTDLEVPEGGALEASFFVAAPASTARAVLWDHEKFPQFMPNAKTAKVLERKGPTVHVVEQVGGQGPITVTLVSERRLESNRIAWRSVRGDVKRNDGEWRFEAVTGGTVLTYRVHVVPHQPVPGAVTRFLQKQALPNMVAAVRRRIEAQPKT
jgi:uncharacterized membrane protein